MKKVFYVSLLLAMTTLCSCKFAGKIAGKAASQLADTTEEATKMDEAATYESIQDAISKLDSKWKVFGIRIRNEGTDNLCQNTFGWCNVHLIDADNQQIYQGILPEVGSPSTSNERVTYDEIPPIDFTAEGAMKNIEACKALIPAEYKFLNLQDYVVTFDKREKRMETEVTINVQEIGKEKIEANGVTEEVYDSLHFTVNPDGSVSYRELD